MNVFAKEACQSCWAKYFCSDGCHANSYFTNGDIGKPNELACAMQRKRIECAIMVEVMRKLNAESVKKDQMEKETSCNE
jgi:uncharacterized protein